MSSLDDVLLQLDNYLHIPGVDAYDLKAFADEDSLGGRGDGNYDGWAIDADEGRILYALARVLHAQQAIEIGVRHGASTAHLLAALKANGSGNLDSYDLEANGVEKHANWAFHQGDALKADFPRADLVFEDGAHSLDFTLTVFTKLKPTTRVLVTHDINMTAAHGDFHVREAFDTVFPDGITITLDGCERGLGVWVNPHWVAPVVETPKAQAVKAQPKPRTPAAKKPTPAKVAPKAKAKR